MEVRFFEEGTVPEWTTEAWYAARERAPHLEQPGHRERLLRTAEFVREAVSTYGAWDVSDMGAGDGGLLSLIEGCAPCWGYDIMPENVDAAVNERGALVRCKNFLTDDVGWGECAVFTEVLEHLLDPHAVVRDCPSRVIVASSPNGETEASHYEFHLWGWDMAGFRGLFEQGGYDVKRHEAAGFQILLGVRG